MQRLAAGVGAFQRRHCTLQPDAFSAFVGSHKLLAAHTQARMTMARTLKLYKLPEETATPGIRAMEQRDVPQV